MHCSNELTSDSYYKGSNALSIINPVVDWERMRYDMMQCTVFTCAQNLTNSQLNLLHGTKWNEETRNNSRCSAETVQSKVPWSLCLERFVKEVGLEPEVIERGNYGWREWWVDRVRRCDRSMNRQVRGRRSGMRLTERTRKLIAETRWGWGWGWVQVNGCALCFHRCFYNVVWITDMTSAL